MSAEGTDVAATAWYPLFADLAGRRCLVVGGGPVATAKARRLADHGARVRLVAPEVTPELAAMATAGAIAEHQARPYRAGDLDGCVLAIAATDREDVNRAVLRDADERAVLCNVVDGSPGSAILPSSVRRGELAVAVSTGGASPVVARHLRRRIEEVVGPEWGELVALMRELRDDLKRRHGDVAARREAVERLMRSDVLRLLAAGDEEGARRLAAGVLDIEGVVA